MIARRTTAAGVRLHLDDRTARLGRPLAVTGTLEHVTESLPTGAAQILAAEENVRAARSTGPHGTN
ncbi:hypothetical protein AB0N93_37990 [Streptomyces sp. NPDC091267]|uniref:hypothetical protein n=1 Tax=unclassified Streptomyces TaxID=2593676 RepID=UPI0034259448